MGKATIQSGGTGGQYQLQVAIHKTQALERIAKLQDQIEQMESGADVTFSPPLATQADALDDLIEAFAQGIEDNRDTEKDDRQLKKQLIFEQAKLDDLKAKLSAAKSVRDAALQDYVDAQADYAAGEISETELDWWDDRYQTAESDVAARQLEVDTQQAVVDGVQTQLDAIAYATLDTQLEQIKHDSAVFLKWAAKEPISQLTSHLEQAESMLLTMAAAVGAAITSYSDVVSVNLQNQQEALDLAERQTPIQNNIDLLTPQVNAAKSAYDSAVSAWETAYVQYLRGEITEADLQPYTDAKEAAATVYSEVATPLAYWQNQHDLLEVQKNQCVAIAAKPMLDRLNKATAVQEQIDKEVAALRQFLRLQELKKIALEKTVERLQAIIAAAKTGQAAWCADLTEDLAAGATVGTIEINGEDKQILVRPGYSDDAAYDAIRDGQLMPVGLATPAQTFYNAALLPGWQKWQPTYRTGKITVIDGDTCTVTLDAAKSAAQEINVNQSATLADVSIEYMSCDGDAFAVGDAVVVQFTGQDWNSPKVIGFVDHPQECPAGHLALIGVSWGVPYYEDYYIIWNCITQQQESIKDSAGNAVTQPCKLSDMTYWLSKHPEDTSAANLFTAAIQENNWPGDAWPDFVPPAYNRSVATNVPDRDGSSVTPDTYHLDGYIQDGGLVANPTSSELDMPIKTYYDRVVNAHNGQQLTFSNKLVPYDSCWKLSIKQHWERVFATLLHDTNYGWKDYTDKVSFELTAVSPLGATTFAKIERVLTASRAALSSDPFQWISSIGTRLYNWYYGDDYYPEYRYLKDTSGDFLVYRQQVGKHSKNNLIQIYLMQHGQETITGFTYDATFSEYHEQYDRQRAVTVHAAASQVEDIADTDCHLMERDAALETAVADLVATWYAAAGLAQSNLRDLNLSMQIRK